MTIDTPHASGFLSLEGTGIIKILAWSSVVLLLYFGIQCLENQYYHPLAKFPGPPWACATWLYGAYYDLLVGPGGQFTSHIRQLHAKYGPVVRISPDEISINDPDFYDEYYGSCHAVKDKIPTTANILGTTSGTFGTIDHHVHQQRRQGSNAFFSSSNLTKADHIIREHVDRLALKLSRDLSTVWETRVQFMALKLDIFYDFAFGDSLHLQDNPRAAEEWDATMEAIATCAPFVKLFPWILPLAVKLPVMLVYVFSPPLARVLRINYRIHKQANMYSKDPSAFQDSKKGAQDSTGRPITLFESLRNSNITDQDKTVWRISQEGSEMFAASGTTARVMSACMFYLHDRPSTLKLLRDELDSAMPCPNSIPPTQMLATLPYLTAVIKESLRIAAPVATRLPLKTREPLRYQKWRIPKDTPVSVNTRDLLQDPRIFDEPETFKPERWLDTDSASKLDKYFVPFSKGPRSCPGQDFAMAELQITVAVLVRRFDFELVDTTYERDVKVVRDCFLTEASPGSRGVKVKVVGLRA